MPRRVESISHLLLFFSGAAGLGYQLVWARMFSTALGHEMPSVLANICAFMVGMAAGAWLLGAKIARSERAGHWYAGLELIIGLWALFTMAMIPVLNQSALQWMGVNPSSLRQWFIAFVLPSVFLLPATAAMGATFPAMVQFLSRRAAEGRAAGAVYASNTLGAVAGILASTYLIAPRLGYSHTVLALAAINLVCAAIMFLIVRTANVRESNRAATRHPSKGVRRLLLTAFSTGLLGIGYEVVGTRVLAQVLENTIYTFACVLSVYLLGTALGAAGYQRYGRRFDSTRLLSALLVATASLCVVGLWALANAEFISAVSRGRDTSAFGSFLREVKVALAVFLAPCLVMGATFAHLAEMMRERGGNVGAVVGCNTIGGAAAAILFGVVLLPGLGSKWTAVLGSLAYLALVPRWTLKLASLTALTLILVLLLPARLHTVTVPAGGRIIAFREGVMAAVAVVEEASGHRVLRVNDRFQMGGTAAADAQYRQAHLPLLLHPAPRRALFLGPGTGITLGAAMLHPDLEIDAVELVPEIVDLMPRFAPHNRSAHTATNVHLFISDARRFVRTSAERYDVIVADLFHPARDGAGALYTVEHFRAVRERLSTNGLFCQWLPLYQMDLATERLIRTSFLEAFGEVETWLLRFNVDLPVIGLIAHRQPRAYSTDLVDSRMNEPGLARELRRLALADSIRLLGHFVSVRSRVPGEMTLLNRDDRPLVVFQAPRYDPNTKPHETLLRFISLESVADGHQPETAAGGPEFGERLERYRNARNIFLRGLAAEAEEHRAEAIDAYVLSAATSEDFTSGYAQCLTIASLLAKSEPEKARVLLERLVEAQPNRPVARDLLQRLNSPPGR